MHAFTAELANTYAGVALANVTTEFPHHQQHLMHSAEDASTPRRLHPAFYGSYDWHSSVHMHWLLVRCVRLQRRIALARPVVETLNAHLAAQHIAVELEYLRAPGRLSFERPYGWAWLLKLAHEVEHLAQSEPVARPWADALAPLARWIAERWRGFLQVAEYPVRCGIHGNSAFALGFAGEWASQTGDTLFARAIHDSAERWFARDKDYPARLEPGGEDFLSGGLCEAVLMQRVLGGLGFSVWWEEFRPKGDESDRWFEPVRVADRLDPKLAHLDGLNLARAWCMRRLLPNIPGAQAAEFERAITAHLDVALPRVVGGDYAGSHWLATFAALALTEQAA